MLQPKEMKESIKRIGIKQNYLAEKLGISLSYLNHYLAERKDLPYEYKVRLNKFIKQIEQIEI